MLSEYRFDLVTPLEYDSHPQGESMAPPPPKERPNWVGWLTLGLLVLGSVVGSAWKLHDELSRIDKHINRVETAVRIIGAKQGGDTKTLVDEALSVAKKASDAGRVQSAMVILGIANRLLEEQKASRVEVPQEFFDITIQKYQGLRKSPELARLAWEGSTRLAEYRSAVSSTPPDFHPPNRYTSAVSIGSLERVGNFYYLKDSLISGPNAVSMSGERGFDIDGFLLENVVFENATIIYKGGPVALRNVRFVNCQFDLQDSPRSEQLLEAAIKQPSNVQIG